MRFECEVSLADVVEQLFGDFEDTARLLLLIAKDHNGRDIPALAVAIREILYVPDDRREDLRRLASALVLAADMD